MAGSPCLLQIDIANLWGIRFAEGAIYFVMRDDDLRSGKFDRVHAIYQQT